MDFIESILKNIPHIILVFDENQKIQVVNTSFGKLMKRRSRDFIGKTLEEINPQMKEQCEPLTQELKDFAKNPTSGKIKDKRENQAASYETRDPLAPPKPSENSNSRLSVITLEGSIFTYQFFQVGGKEAAEPYIGLIMTEINEERKLLDSLTVEENISGLHTLAAGIAHEINNPLFSIIGHAEGIIYEKDYEKIKTYAMKIKDRSMRMAKVIADFSGYSQGKKGGVGKAVNINEILDSAISVAMIPFNETDIILVRNYETLLPFIAVSEEIQKLFVIIIDNALQAMKGKGKLSISTSQPNDHIVIKFKDAGPGIPSEYLAKIFLPFFTTKDQGEGTGLGLNIAQRLAHKYNGEILVNSKINEGTEVSISFSLKAQQIAT